MSFVKDIVGNYEKVPLRGTHYVHVSTLEAAIHAGEALERENAQLRTSYEQLVIERTQEGPTKRRGFFARLFSP